nr:S-methyl-5-thioribose-1-phosphate isomerase [Lachnospiraceae bacterium]
GLYTVCKRNISKYDNTKEFLGFFNETKDRICSSRPTAVNLAWALNRMAGSIEGLEDLTRIMETLRDTAIFIYEDDIRVCRAIGENGLSFIKDGYGILTHCNAGRLATVRYGTATSPMYLAHEKGMKLKVYCDVSRPLLQGARLTSFELSEAGLDTTLLCDNMSSALMRSGAINAIFVGCDRVAANGDFANKIGTSAVAILAKRYDIPFYVCAPSSTIDMNSPDKDSIVIEQRKPEEVTEMWYSKRMAPEGISVYNPAFDVTDHEDVTAIITEYGVVEPPFEINLPKLCSLSD